MNTQRPIVVTVAVIIHAVLSVGNILLSIPFPNGATLPDDGPPLFIIIVTLIIGVVGLVTAWATWQLKRWGSTSTIVLRVLDSLASAPAIFFAPLLGLQMGAALGIVLSLVVIWLLLMPATRRVMA
ncbi:MAG: hypothetical protein U0401_14370 [Anaerolineae bacterium]